MNARLAILGLLAAGISGAAPIAIEVFPATAPNRWGGPSFSGWEQNAIYALEHDLSAYGAPGTPTYYQQRDVLTQNEILVTNFNSWEGQVDPGTLFGPAFANEFGNRVHFGFVVDARGSGQQISISQLTFGMASDDPGHEFDMAPDGGFVYSSGYVGIRFHDGVAEYITGGDSTQLVDMIVSRGVGSGLWPCAPDPDGSAGCTDRQTAMDIAAAYNNPTTWHIYGTYSLGGVSATGTATINPVALDEAVPEPGTFLLIGIGLILLATIAKKRLRV